MQILFIVLKFPLIPKSLPLFGDTEPAIQRCCVRAVLHCPVRVRLLPPSITEFEDVPVIVLEDPPIIEERLE
jgi:hypothetical protein